MLNHKDRWMELIGCNCKSCEETIITDENRINNTFLYHSFPRWRKNGEENIAKGLKILKSIVENGLLLNCETKKWMERLQNGQLSSPINLMSISCSFTLLEEYELINHCNKFGNFSLEFEIQTMRKLGAIPIFYIPNPKEYYNTCEPLGSVFLCRLHEITFLLENCKNIYKVEKVSHSNPYYEVDIDHHINSIHRLASLFYPTERDADDELLNYYRQKEWRIIGSILMDGNEVTRKLSEEQKKVISDIDPEFFNGELENRNGQMVKRIDICQIFKDFNQKPFIEYARRLIVPDQAFDQAYEIVSVLDNPPEIISLNNIQKAKLIKYK